MVTLTLYEKQPTLLGHANLQVRYYLARLCGEKVTRLPELPWASQLFSHFFHKTWRTVNMRKRCWLALKGDLRSWTNFSPFFNTLARPAESTLTSVYARKKLTPFARANNVYACSDYLKHTHDRGDPVGRAKVFLWRKVDPAWRVTMLLQKGDSARLVIILAESNFCFSCERFATFLRKCMKSWLAQESWGQVFSI